MKNRIITVDEIMGWDPCGFWPRERVATLIGDGKTLFQIADLPGPPDTEDKFWVLVRESILPKPRLHMLACDWAEHVADKYGMGEDDSYVREAIEAGRRLALGEWVNDQAQPIYNRGRTP
jgi:hypothetical protein